jgi:hypothetical protein
MVQKLREHKLYAKFEEYEFGVKQVEFLGHRITKEGLKIDDHKIREILDWEPPRLVLALLIFGVSFVISQVHKKNFNKLFTPLATLGKKSL